MSWRVGISLLRLREQINEAFPDRLKVSDGTIGDIAHSARTSDHNPNEAGVVCAMDITNDPEQFPGQAYADALVASRDERIKYIIFNHRMCRSYPSGSLKAWQWGPYSGMNAHEHHVHLSVRPESRYYDSNADWRLSIFETPVAESVSSVTTETVSKTTQVPSEAGEGESTVTEQKSSFTSTIASSDTVKEIAKSGVSSIGAKISSTLAGGGLLAAIDSFVTEHWAGLIFAGFMILLAVIVILFVLWHKHRQQQQTATTNASRDHHDIRFK